MNAAAILIHAALAAVLASVAVAAQARGGVARPPEQSIPHSLSVSSGGADAPSAEAEAAGEDGRPAVGIGPELGKTRAQVRAELLQAGEQGMLPPRWVDYPPSAATRERNRENFLRLEQVWKEEGIIPTTSVSGTNGSNEEQR
jgi:hypothetical protein